ncbi:thioredoxin-dependent thiol peroxidase [Thermosynechococcus sp. HN-54]|uniref:thioredoxin-dependent thiol peroxidase n=1 Tax=Thermosynechococcus sp. HN-54 TaxID=2933959 RepID=UPI00202CEDA2|nr:thioredoxin-dependent thiol peroxidase [Thermosynechococcus sp. HN-54]URR35882.1 thioredoxin-dependent thiol peroxidase [Thermosynechococcus sp. HN-54]
MSLTVGAIAPPFELADATGELVRLADFQGQWVILYFYPRDNTPGCTKEACAYREVSATLGDRNVVILGISPDSVASHAKFQQKLNLPFRLLADVDTTVAQAYGSYGPKKFMGKDYLGVYRDTFLIDPTGKIAAIYRRVKPDAHVAQVLADLERRQA